MKASPIPQRIHRGSDHIVITWNDHHQATYPARDLRLRCHCAACRDEMSGAPLLDPDTVAADVAPAAISLVGSYAIKIRWSDGHDTGIYTYEMLYSICPCDRCRKTRDASAK